MSRKSVKQAEIEKNEQLDLIFEFCSERERLFVIGYCRTLSMTEGARNANYSPASAGQRGYEVYHRPNVKKAIQEYLRFTAITPDENRRLIQATAKLNMSDYFTYKTTIETVRTRVGVGKLINDLEEEIDLEDEYLLECGNLSKPEQTLLMQKIRDLQKQKQRFEIIFRKNPAATRVVYVDTPVKEKVLDIEKIVADRVPLKSIKHTKDGVHVETYSAADAQISLAKVMGDFEADNKQSRPIVNNMIGLTPDKLAKLSEEELLQMARIEEKMNS